MFSSALLRYLAQPAAERLFPLEEHDARLSQAWTLQGEYQRWREEVGLEPTLIQSRRFRRWQAWLVRAGVGWVVDGE